MENVIDLNEKKIQSYVNSKRPPIEIRDKLDFGYKYEGRTVELFAIRPKWNTKDEYQHIPYARIKYVKTLNIWKLYWQRASLKWVTYEPLPQSSNLEELLEVIEADEYGCFYGFCVAL